MSHLGGFFWVGLASNVLTLLCAFGWVRFFDTRKGYIGTPNDHHRKYMQALMVASSIACIVGVLAAFASMTGMLAQLS